MNKEKENSNYFLTLLLLETKCNENMLYFTCAVCDIFIDRHFSLVFQIRFVLSKPMYLKNQNLFIFFK